MNAISKKPSVTNNQKIKEKKMSELPWRTHMKETISSFSKRFRSKFIRGVKEHGGNLHMKPAIKMIEWSLDEVVDLVSYQSVLLSHLKTIQHIVDNAINPAEILKSAKDYRNALEKISNILQVGNSEGKFQKGD